ncbi:4-alpha-glucanotransferase [Ancylothrix sp. C2]|uniref:4-alpha-glucanotransferase n=1 Tax=Ancylothrix sp. D3o TaxID=2953691 RepID=UPI0021BA938E|nr:4-alpha-glucanotransferase [Ancylothrix sp. D3o]MCT7949550.1 4-alpha-glucanotransferase [Ancylothrix sp. D3o]
MPFPRTSGILLHPTSLPSRFGVGDLGRPAYEFIDFLVESNQKLWQVLPLGPTGYGNSPYMCYSAMAGNPILINLDLLVEDGLLSYEDIGQVPDFPSEKVDFEQVLSFKLPLLQKACQNFVQHSTENLPEEPNENFQPNWAQKLQQEFQTFCAGAIYWLNDYALFMSLKAAHAGDSWHTWDLGIRHREPAAVEAWKLQLKDEIQYHNFVQFIFFRQWSALKKYANQKGIEIIGDIPIYVAADSADVWAHPEIFCLDEETSLPSLMAGVPPDYFSSTGQLWGNPVYDWDKLEQTDFDWWIKRFEVLLDYVDIIRIDHFRGFEAYWAVKQGETTALNGEWLKASGDEFFEVLNEKLGKLPVMAEDLGIITPEVEALRDKFELPGMKILHFAFGGNTDNPYLPFNISRNSVIYTGTHDNDTTVGWFNNLGEHEKQNLLDYLGCTSSDGIHWDLIRLAQSSVANQAIFPLQDILGLGTEARMNYPGKAEGNWEWRYQAGALTHSVSSLLKKLTHIYGR